MTRRRFGSRSPFGKQAWNFPPFSPTKLGEYVVKEVRVTHWSRLDRYIIAIVVTESLYNQSVSGFYFARRFRFGFEGSVRPMFVKSCSVTESTITLCIAGAPNFNERFKRTDPLLLQSVKNPECKLRISSYTLSELEVPKPPDPDDIPF